MVSVLIDKNTKKIISIVEGQRVKSTLEYDVYYTHVTDEFEIYKELNKTDLLYSSEILFDIVFKREALGDTLMLLPVISGLKKKYPYLKIALQTDEWIVPLLSDIPFLDFVTRLDVNLLGLKVDLRKIGDFIAIKDGRENKHRTYYYEDYVKEEIENFNYKFQPDFNYKFYFKENKSILSLLNDVTEYVVLAPKSKSYYRMWGYRDNKGKDFHLELDLIKKMDHLTFVVLHNSKIFEFDDIDNVVNLSGKLDIIECATVCKYASFGIVPDSGIMHLLDKLKIPTIALFGNVTEPDYRLSNNSNIVPLTFDVPKSSFDKKLYNKDPYCHLNCCWDAQVEDCVGTLHEKWCMKKISVDDVIEKYKNIQSKLNSNNYLWSKLVTFVFIGDADIDNTLDIISRYKKMEIPNIKFLSSKDVGIDEWVKIRPLFNSEEYNKFVLTELHKYIDTDFIILSQWDGFILNLDAWLVDFLKYDFIGAEWDFLENTRAGNGGFSLRSKKFLIATSELELKVFTPEDKIIEDNSQFLENNFGIDFAPTEIKNKFSVERGVHEDQFGFHGFHTQFPTEKYKDIIPTKFYHSGDLGDIIYALCAIKNSGGGILILSSDYQKKQELRQKMSMTTYKFLKGFIKSQSYIHDVVLCDRPIDIDYNLNDFRDSFVDWGDGKLTPREEKKLKVERLTTLYKNNVLVDLPNNFDNQPWLEWSIKKIFYNKSIVVNRTLRYLNPNFPWQLIVENYRNNIIFVGLADEYEKFVLDFGWVQYVKTETLEDLVDVLNGSKLFIGNQSFPHAIAQGLFLRVLQETSTEVPNCMFRRKFSYITDTKKSLNFGSIKKYIDSILVDPKIKTSLNLGSIRRYIDNAI